MTQKACDRVLRYSHQPYYHRLRQHSDRRSLFDEWQLQLLFVSKLGKFVSLDITYLSAYYHYQQASM